METTIDYGSDYGAEASDYDSLTRGKLCPLKATEPPDLDAILRVSAIKCRTDGVPGGTPTSPAAPSSPWPATNNNTPGLLLTEWAGVALCLVWRCAGLCTAFCGVGI